MKHNLVLIAASAGLLMAQEPSNHFKKATQEPGTLESGVRVFQLVEVDQKTLQNWHQTNPGKELARYHAQPWLESGKATLIDTSLIHGSFSPKKPGTHEIIVTPEIIYPSSYSPARHQGEWPIAREFYTRNSGLSWQVTFLPTSELQDRDRWLGGAWLHTETEFHAQIIKDTSQEGDIGYPVFHSYRTDQSYPHHNDYGNGTDEFDSMSASDKAFLIFSEGKKRDLPSAEKRLAHASDAITVFASFVEVPTEKWTSFSKRHALAEIPLAANQFTQAEINQGTAKLIHSTKITIPLGQKGVHEDVREIIYPTEYSISPSPTPISLENALIPSAFDTRNTGFTLELEPFQHSSGHILTQYSAALNSYHGKAAFHRHLDDQEWNPTAWMPRFTSVRFLGTVALPPAKQTLVSVCAASSKNGDIDQSKRILFFLQSE